MASRLHAWIKGLSLKQSIFTVDNVAPAFNPPLDNVILYGVTEDGHVTLWVLDSDGHSNRVSPAVHVAITAPANPRSGEMYLDTN